MLPGEIKTEEMLCKPYPDTVYLYEVYRDEAALEAHRQAPHFVKWRETVKDMFDGSLLGSHSRADGLLQGRGSPCPACRTPGSARQPMAHSKAACQIYCFHCR